MLFCCPRVAAVACALVAAAVGCTEEDDPHLALPFLERVAIERFVADTPTCVGKGQPRFTDTTLSSGLLHQASARRDAGAYHAWYGGGIALVDLDNDGHLDAFVTDPNSTNRTFRGDGKGGFTDVTTQHTGALVGLGTVGVSAADYDGDGLLDLYLARWGPDVLLRNATKNGELRFEDVTDSAGIDVTAPSSGASWADFDGDGDLDLWVAAPYAKWEVLAPEPTTTGKARLFRNDNGVFVPVPTFAGPKSDTSGASFLGIAADLDGDGSPDLVDTQEFGHLQATRIFRNTSKDAIAFTAETTTGVFPEAVMGGALFDGGDGRFDLLLTNLRGVDGKGEVYLRNDGGLSFSDITAKKRASAMDLAAPSTRTTRAVSWAALAADIDNDADEDLFIVYGALPVHGLPEAMKKAFPARFQGGQADALLLRDKDGRFAAAEGSCAEDKGRGRGAAIGDINGDGCLDLVIVNVDGAIRVLQNRCEDTGAWLAIRLRAKGGNRHGIGAVIDVTHDATTQRRMITAGSTSVHSTQPFIGHFGLGSVDPAATVTVAVQWRNGQVSKHAVAGVNRTVTLAQP